MDKVVVIIAVILIVAVVILTATPIGRGITNRWFYKIQKVDDRTNYNTMKQVEDSCRTMIVSYTSDCLTYEQYKDSNESEKSSWAEQAKMRANKTATSYNEYVLKNSYVWDGNIPSDIKAELAYIK